MTDVKTAWSNLMKVRAGVDLIPVRELPGHANIKMTLRYAHLCLHVGIGELLGIRYHLTR